MTSDPRFPLLSAIDIPRDLRDLPESKLPQVAEELRGFLVESVGKTGGHLASSLGTVELTVALHYVYQTPEDRILWDVGHQAYGHKVLTGRRQRMDTLRMRDGLSGFLKRAESPYDAFGAGHSSTSIGAALGMAVAAQKQNNGRRVAAVIGDGALTAGMAFEALNHAGDLDVDLLVVLNDNDMSISPNVGGLSNYLARLLSGPVYSSMRESGKRMLSHTPFEELARRAEEHLKGMVMPGTLFEELGFNYIGPIDGHDLPTLVTALRNLRERSGPQFLHIVTQKGKGYAPAEAKPQTYHGVGRYDPSNGKLHKGKPSGPSYSQVFGDWLSATAERTPEMVAITPAMCTGSGMTAFADAYPDRFYDVGIAEQHALTLAAGMACEGLRPVVAIYSTFLQRAYDQLIHDIALQNLPVLLAIDRAGFVGNDGATHDGIFDLSYLRCIPNLVVMTPSDEEECRRMLSTGLAHDGPSAVRYPRGTGRGVQPSGDDLPLEIGRGVVRREGRGVALLAFGSLLGNALEVGDSLDATVADMRFVKPLDNDLVDRLAASHDLLVTLEENVVAGGAGSAVAEHLHRNGAASRLLQIGIPDRFFAHGSPADVVADAGLDAASIRAAIDSALAGEASNSG
ncbi:MAG: 1-deoxy-D-xylulose-5-phosphate synthase [Gammaproteobacteria bacterium]|nr:MAG: 1-deoxy-D-xylulose-5-phosphate synthase [Gammaproteobacteria bacterium]